MRARSDRGSHGFEKATRRRARTHDMPVTAVTFMNAW
jgi:hypothetical protein